MSGTFGTPFKKGDTVRTGRKPGAAGRFVNLKKSFLEVFNELGGSVGLLKWAKKNPRNTKEFYILLAKMLPKDMNVQVEGQTTLADKIKEARARAAAGTNGSRGTGSISS